MNLNRSNDIDELQTLLINHPYGKCHYMLWVDITGEVQLSAIPEGITPPTFASSLGDKMTFRCPTIECGSSIVGSGAQDPKNLPKIQAYHRMLTSNHAKRWTGLVSEA